ncbi:hypothetical protein JM946_17580 [Steroidobacter sp. S1-65]|uniref:Beta-ketoacyl-[acyl-carrier-protein] synthase III N-terminal domain-containing protein n=1 Tax=Steroidobacter gossypii TaxID=2805490 RepID=A0ABS1X003_9GAMM|nr:hypothetical protein [Steroidobacter gossypii]MBM0106543.1 hypothetical protein [Steroidobacter gossypii]
MSAVALHSLSFELGNTQREVLSIDGVEGQFKRAGLPANTKMLGCRYFYEARQPLEEMISATMSRTLADAALDASEIDAFVFASARHTAESLDRSFVQRLLQKHGLQRAMPLAVSLQECLSLLTAIDVATRSLQDEDMRSALVVCFDVTPSDDDRVAPYGVLSDAASSCIVSKGRSGLQILGYASGYDWQGATGTDDFNVRTRLGQSVLKKSLQRAGLQPQQLSKVFSTNFFEPISKVYAAALSLKQVYTRTAASYGHCACSDPIINMLDYLHSNPAASGEHFMLQSYAPGFMAMLPLRATGRGVVAS